LYHKFLIYVINIIYRKGGDGLLLEAERKNQINVLERDIIPVIPDKIAAILRKLPQDVVNNVEEIRLRSQKPLMIFKGGQDYFVDDTGKVTTYLNKGTIVDRSDMDKSLQLMCNYSIYSVEEELKQGFLTLRGGHRVGLTGRIVVEGKKIRTLKNISGINIRVAREVMGCGTKLVKSLYSTGIKHTLIASPPGCGKTTLLRDMIRLLSNGIGDINLRGHKIGVVDERSEIAGCYLGIPQRDVGVRTDVLDACPKAQGMIMLLRSMSPEIIAVDEIGSQDDADAIEDAIYSGIKVIATAHGRDIDEILKRPGVKSLVDHKAFERIVILSRKNGPGTIEDIITMK
jgi:stage III sporulation protein AA